MLQSIIQGGDIGKGLFLMVVGILFVFAVQVLLYALIKIAMKSGGKKA
jgi:Na+-transporting methylmalonyl-CoA/oxaloacetate decarboxylase gamma subunit